MTTLRHRRSAAAVLTAVLLGGALAGCSAAEDQARSIAGSAAGSASSAAVTAVTDQVCAVVEDGQISESDVAVLGGLVDTAQAAGVDSEVLTALEDVTGTDGTPPESAVAELTAACSSGSTAEPS